jgi:hypothetical protein
MSMSRRSFLATSLGASVAALVLVACGGDDDSGGTAGSTTGGDGSGSTAGSAAAGTDAAGGGLVAVQFFPPGTFPNVAGQPQRWPFGVGNRDGVVMDAANAPVSLQAYVRDVNGTDMGEPLTVPRRNKDLERPYYPLLTELDAGQYQVTFVLPDGTSLEPAFFTVQEPGTTAVPVPGAPMPSFATPTTADALGVDPICTHQPPCALHVISLDDALASGKPTVLLVGTPAYCATGICGPVLELLERVVGTHGDKVNVIHAEVYTDDTLQTTTPAVQELGLDYEPALFVVDAEGTLRHRLDVVYDADELSAALADVAGPA